MEMIIDKLRNYNDFNRTKLLEVVREENSKFSENSLSWYIKKLMKEKQIIRISRNKYCVYNESLEKKYEPIMSESAKKIAGFINENYPLVNYCILETCHLNEFLNHQIGNNIIIVEVENMFENIVYTELKNNFHCNTLLKPTTKELMYYQGDETIIVMRLVSEAPINKKDIAINTIEKLYVDLTANKVLKKIITDSEYKTIYEIIGTKYILDVRRLMRYL